MKERTKDLTVFFAIIAGIITALVLVGQNMTLNMRVNSTAGFLVGTEKAVAEFQRTYGGLPGDLPNANDVVPGCKGDDGRDCNPHSSGAGDGIIGRRNFFPSLQPQVTGTTNIPATSPADETVLFWAHLSLADLPYLSTGVWKPGIYKNIPIQGGVTHPFTKFGGVPVAGYWDGNPLPKSLSPASEGMKGNVIVNAPRDWLKGGFELNASGMQPLSPKVAARIDRKIDDGNPGTGKLQAYGSPLCFEQKAASKSALRIWDYAEDVSTKECGLIYLITPAPDAK